ncbi:MAG: hypothetical protein IKU00_03595 [Bacteroidales bacterium]|nr:hypothetical protein [Bacteroidales bacterium]
MKRFSIIVALCTLNLLQAFAQYQFRCDIDTIIHLGDSILSEGLNHCHEDLYLNDTCIEYYGNLNQYIPDMDISKPLHVPPIKTIRLNINVIQKSNGTGNFENNETTRVRLRQILEWINQRYDRFAPSEMNYYLSAIENDMADLESQYYNSLVEFLLDEHSYWKEPNQNKEAFLNYTIAEVHYTPLPNN